MVWYDQIHDKYCNDNDDVMTHLNPVLLFVIQSAFSWDDPFSAQAQEAPFDQATKLLYPPTDVMLLTQHMHASIPL